jgi:TonB family protein
MKYIFLVFTILFFSNGFSQPDTTLKYFNANLEMVSKNNAVYTGKVFQSANGWNALISNSAGVLLLKASFRDKNLQTKNGLFTYYHPDGSVAIIGMMDNNLQTGTWKSWYPNGKMRDSTSFLRGLKDGYAASFFENGNPKLKGNYRGDDPIGEWTWYHENGNIATKEKYVNSKLTDLQCFDSTGKFTGIQCSIETPPTIKGIYGGVNKYIMDSLIFPKEALDKRITGVVDVEFTVTKYGEMANFRILSTPSKILSDEVLRVILSVKGWYPAVEHNRTIDYVVKLKVPFYRNDEQEDE